LLLEETGLSLLWIPLVDIIFCYYYYSMGNICCGTKEEEKKKDAWIASSSSLHKQDAGTIDESGSALDSSSDARWEGGLTSTDDSASASSTLAASSDARLQAMRQEQARLEVLVQAAGRRMVAVRSTRGNHAYYDQGFAAALSQHLESTCHFPALPQPLPPPCAPDVAQRFLSEPAWKYTQLGPGEGLAGCGDENPVTYLNHVVESYLDSVLVKKEQLFGKSGLIVETLL
jgi:hypothetical protein